MPLSLRGPAVRLLWPRINPQDFLPSDRQSGDRRMQSGAIISLQYFAHLELYPQPHPRAGKRLVSAAARRQATAPRSQLEGQARVRAMFVAAIGFFSKHTRSRAPSLAALLVIT